MINKITNFASPEEIKKNLISFYNSHKEECDSKYNDATDKNKLKIYREIKNENQINELFFKTTVVILTANMFEKNVLHLNAFNEKNKKIKHCIINSYCNLQRPLNINAYFFDIGDYHVLHLEAKQTGSYSMGGSADLIRFIMRNEYCYPSAIISYGICFGNDYKDQKIGDTIIVNKLYPYFMSAKVKEKYFFVRDSNIFDIDTQLDTKIQYLIGIGELSERDRIFYGNMVTGEAVISNEIMRDIFIKAATNQPVLGGEMEGYGLFKECRGFECSIPCLIIKSICDWGVYKNFDDDSITDMNLKDKLQVFAAHKAYEALTIFMKKDSEVFESSIYDQVKEFVYDEKVIPKSLLEDMLNDNIKSYKKYKNVDKLCTAIFDELLCEGIIEHTESKTVYRLKEVK